MYVPRLLIKLSLSQLVCASCIYKLGSGLISLSYENQLKLETSRFFSLEIVILGANKFLRSIHILLFFTRTRLQFSATVQVGCNHTYVLWSVIYCTSIIKPRHTCISPLPRPTQLITGVHACHASFDITACSGQTNRAILRSD